MVYGHTDYYHVLKNDHLTLVPYVDVFFSRWCGPCKILGPRLEKAVAKQKGRVAMAKVDIDDHTDLAIEYGVRLQVFFGHYCHFSFFFIFVFILLSEL